MAAILQQLALAPVHRASPARRVANDLADRSASADVMAIMDSVHASDDEVWMMSYMDIMTLLLTLFVLLLAYSKIAPETAAAALPAPVVVHQAPKPAPHVAVKDALPRMPTPHHFTVIALPKPILSDVKPAAVQVQATRGSEQAAPQLPAGLALWSESASADFTPPLKVAAQPEVVLAQDNAAPETVTAREKFLDQVRASALGKRIELTADQDNVNLAINDNILFDPGSATLKAHGEQLLNELATLLGAQDYAVSIEGHSDDVPFANARFASNWELSATRATNVTRYLIAHGISAVRLRAIGYADTHPRADNASIEGRARNRRVSLVLHMPVVAAARAGGEERNNTDPAVNDSKVNLSLSD